MTIDINTYVSQLELGTIFTTPIADAISRTFALGVVQNNTIMDFVPAFVVRDNNINYIVANSGLTNPNALLINNTYFPLTAYAKFKGRDTTYRLSVYEALSPIFKEFSLWGQPLREGLKVFSIGSHSIVGNNFDLTLGAADGIISKPSRNLSNKAGDAYIQHTVEMLGYNNDFGPLFTIQNQTPYLIGINTAFDFIDANDPSYIGISFAHPTSAILSVIRRFKS